MRRAILLAALLLVCAGIKAQTSDAALLRRASFDAPITAADTLGQTVSRQLFPACPFIPDHRTFFRNAVREAGFIPAVFFTLDRETRGTRVGTSQHHHCSEDGFIHEDVEAYLQKKKKKP